jgi:hypothetical protein
MLPLRTIFALNRDAILEGVCGQPRSARAVGQGKGRGSRSGLRHRPMRNRSSHYREARRGGDNISLSGIQPPPSAWYSVTNASRCSARA